MLAAPQRQRFFPLHWTFPPKKTKLPDSKPAEKARAAMCRTGTPALLKPSRRCGSLAIRSLARPGVLMSRYLGPKVRLSRRLGVAIADLPKHNKAEFVPPGMHGGKRA